MRVYQIFVDRFSTGSGAKDSELSMRTSRRWMGGNLRGVEKHLDHIKSMNFDAIWLSPVFKSGSYHGYDVIDHFHVDPHFGSERDLAALVRKAHSLGMKVILDFVANHVSNRHPFFVEALKDKRSEHRSWFRFDEKGNYACFMNVKELPKLDLQKRDPRNFMLDIASYWIDNFDIDGYRLDHAIGPPKDFWREFVHNCRNKRTDFIFLPEIWFAGVGKDAFRNIDFFDEKDRREIDSISDAKDDISLKVWNSPADMAIQRYALKKGENIFGSVLDFEYNFKIRKKVIMKEEDLSVDAYPNRFSFLDNHDMQRIAWIANTIERMKEAIKELYKAKDLVFYYGTEIGMTQMKDFSEYKAYADTEARRFMNWNPSGFQKELLRYVLSLSKSV